MPHDFLFPVRKISEEEHAAFLLKMGAMFQNFPTKDSVKHICSFSYANPEVQVQYESK